MFIFQLFGWFLFSCALISFIEHQFHCWFMHKKNFLSEHNAKYKRILEAHAGLHHGHYAKAFTDEPVPPGEDEEIRLTVRKAPIKVLPIALVIALFSWSGALVFLGTAVFHHWVWNNIHLEMHKPEHRIFSEWPIYKWLARYHCLHHLHPDKNFNVVFPFADYILGTSVHASTADLQYLQAQGL